MAKKKPTPRPAADLAADRPATLKDLLSPDIVSKLREQADELKQEEAKRQEAARKQAEEARKDEQKRLEQDFAYLLENSDPDWRKYK
ncbi:DUF3886 domain-containing protein [Paenibacillus thermoaerophilus]|uniref:DUF3886 domain-containing protein n=1 Tax=Paenibacillus thermoaerophilus TaxID=1215385 RepID=A0ABW2UZ85_9BACL|nr:DUF3886 domain-containing protein [Paenibacillus thermoaerophilus]TMV15863.1 DUF3886 domain-containing protein [Paenibacillus thermoaerophilus]